MNDNPKETKNQEPVNAEKIEDQEFEEISPEDFKPSLEEENSGLKEQNYKLSDENSKLKNELDTLKDRILRISAEYENFRKRTAKEKEGIYTDACEDVLSSIFPVMDNLERAFNVQGSIDDLKKGIEMTLRQFNDALSKLNVEEIPTDGQFDPNLHNAVMHIEDKQFDTNQVVEVFQKGYKRGNKVLRHSMVKVAN